MVASINSSLVNFDILLPRAPLLLLHSQLSEVDFIEIEHFPSLVSRQLNFS